MGEVFAGRFELIEPIADGGMGSVWQVRDLRDGQEYAGKLLRQSDASSLLRFMREQATRFQHDHIVTPVSWAGEDDRVLFTMPLVRGGSVATLIGDHGPLPDGWTAELLRQTLTALEVVHAKGVVHRDIKPANLLLEPTGADHPHLRLTDFGIAAAVDDPRLTRASQVIGSPGYMSAAQLGGGDPVPEHDLYSVAVVGLEMATGQRPPACLAAAHSLAGRPLVDLLLEVTEAPPATAAAFASAIEELDLPAPESDPEAPYVFEQISGATPTPTREDDATPKNRDRTVAFTLLLISVACAIGAIALLL